jgi:transcriptional regulator with XRE-family HTH domain
MTALEALSTTLTALVKESGIRHPELARRVGVSDRSLRGYLSGEVFPLAHLDAILAEIGVSPARFLTRAASEAMR